VAIKIIDLDAVDDEIVELQKEIAILSDLDSKYITKYIGILAIFAL
jgi:serine/threonine-protein kinase 24/25/MST4